MALTVCQAISIAMTVAGAGRQLQREAQQFGVGLLVGAANMGPDPGADRGTVRGDLGEPDRGLDRIDLAEERPQVLELMMPPMLQEARGRRRHLPLVRVRQVAPVFDIAPDLVDDRGRVVFLLRCREAMAAVEYEFGLRGRARRRFCGFGTGVSSFDSQRFGAIWLIGCPSASSSQCRPG
jgi:hypothetical protein